MSASLLNQSMVNREFQKSINHGRMMLGLSDLSIRTNLVGPSVTFGYGDRPPAAREKTGPRQAHASKAGRISLVNKEWQGDVTIKVVDAERDQTGVFRSSQIAMLGQRLAEVEHQIITSLINTNGVCEIDGQNFFDTDHSLGSSGTQNNAVTASQCTELAVASSTDVPTPEEAADIINQMTSYMLTYKDEAGRPLHLGLSRIAIWVSPIVWGPFNTAIMANNLAAGRDNPVAGLKTAQIAYDLYMNPMFTTATHVHMFRVDQASTKPFIFNEEKAATVRVLDENSEHAIKTGEMLVAGDWQGGATYGEPLSAIRGTISH